MFAEYYRSVKNPGFECMTNVCENERSENQQVCSDCKNGLIAFNMEREPIEGAPAYHGPGANPNQGDDYRDGSFL